MWPGAGQAADQIDARGRIEGDDAIGRPIDDDGIEQCLPLLVVDAVVDELPLLPPPQAAINATAHNAANLR